MKLPALIAALLIPGALLAQTRVTIPVQDPVYRDIDRLIALRLVEVGLYGQRPYSRREIARLAREAAASLNRRSVSAATRGIVERLASRFAHDVRELNLLEKTPNGSRLIASVDAVQIESPARTIPADQLGSVAATINPLLNRGSGRDFVDHTNLALALRAEAQRGDRVALVLAPRITLPGTGRMEVASVVLPVRNVTIEIGRQPIVWGQGMDGGLLFSSSGKPLDMVRVSTDLPFRGWFIQGTSPMRGSIIAADLGPRQHFPRSYLIAYKLSGHPFTNRIELAASVLGVQGGRGAPRGTFTDHVQDLIPPLKYLLPDNTTQFSNKMAGWEYRLRLPELRGLQLYAEHAFEDMDPRRWKSTFWEDGGHLVGASINDLGAGGALSATWEFHHTGLRFYKHGVFLSGMTFNGTILGDPLGNQGNGSYMRFNWDRGRNRSVTMDVAIERRTGDSYRAVSDGPDEDNFRFERLQAFPAEWRSRVQGSWRTETTGGSWAIHAGFERVRDFGFVSGATRNNYLISVGTQGLLAAAFQRP